MHMPTSLAQGARCWGSGVAGAAEVPGATLEVRGSRTGMVSMVFPIYITLLMDRSCQTDM